MIRYLGTLLLLCSLLACQNEEPDAEKAPTPDQTEDYQILSAGPLKMAIDPNVGARIASFTYEGREILKTSRDEANLQWGSTVWTSPQSDWNWPPPLFDTAKFDVAKTAENRMHFYSPIDTTTNLQIIKSVRLAIDEARGPLATLRYQVYNRGTEPVKVAVWENTRVPFSGSTRFASGGELRLGVDSLGVEVSDVNGISLIDFTEGQPNKQKIFYDPPPPTKKYLYSTYENEGLLLVKSWRRPVGVAPEQSRLEIYLAPKQGFAELEVQGAYREIQPKEHVDLVVFWQLMPVDDLEKQMGLLN